MAPNSPPLWWQKYVAGVFKAPRQLLAAVRQEIRPDQPDPSRFFGAPKDGPQWDAPQRLAVHPSYFTSESYLRQSTRADWQHTDPRLMRWAALFVEHARKRNIPLYIHCAYRGSEEQERLLAAGHSNAPPGKSAHNIGEAVDIVHSKFHWEMTRQEWALLHVLGLRTLEIINAPLKKEDKLSLTWGGDFKALYDPAHWEITDFRNRRRSLLMGDPIHRTPRHILKHY